MGTNKHYPDKADRDMGKRIDQIVTRPMPISLTPEELDLENHPVRKAESSIPVQAWTRFYEATIRVEAEAFEWTDRAVHIHWVGSDGQHRTAWVWANAVDRK